MKSRAVGADRRPCGAPGVVAAPRPRWGTWSGWLLLCALAGVSSAAAQELPTQPILRIETGTHLGRIWHCDVDAAGRFLLTVGLDDTVRLWELSTGRLLRVFRTPYLPPTGNRKGTISPDGAYVAVSSHRMFFVFDRATGQVIQRIPGVLSRRGVVRYSQDMRRFVVGAVDGSLRVYQLPEYRLIFEDAGYDAGCDDVSFAPDGRMVTMGADGDFRLYSPTFELLARKHYVGGGRVAFSPDGTAIAAGYFVVSGTDLSLLYNADMSGATNYDRGTGWSPDGHILYAAVKLPGGRRALRRWADGGRGAYQDVETMDHFPGRDLDAGLGYLPTWSLSVTRDGRIVCTTFMGEWAVFSPAGVRLLYQRPAACLYWPRSDRPDPLQVSQDGGAVRFQYPSGTPSEAAFVPQLRELRLGGARPEVATRGALTGSAAMTVEAQVGFSNSPLTVNGKPYRVDSGLRSYAVSPAEAKLVIGSWEHIHVLDDQAKELRNALCAGAVQAVNVSGDGRFVVVGLLDGTIRWHRMSDLKEVLAFFPYPDGKRWVMSTPSGYYDCSPGGEDLIGWHVNNGFDQAPDFYPASRFRGIYYRPDVVGKVLQTLDESEALRLADEEAGRMHATADIGKMLPPVVALLSPTDGSEVGTPSVALRYLVRTPSDAPVTQLRVLVDGRPAETQRSVAVRPVGEVREIPVTLPARDCEVSLLAENKYAAGVPCIVRLHWKGSGPASPGVRPKLYLVAAGISAYQDPDLRLGLAAKDAQDFAATVRRQGAGLYASVDARVLTDGQATRAGVIGALEWIQAQTTQGDVAMVFLAGHGVNDNQGRYLFVPADFDRDRPDLTGVPGEEIRRVVAETRGRVLFFLDSCHSGNALGSGARRRLDATGFINTLASAENGAVVFTAATGSQVAFENPAWGNGAFTRALIEGLSGKADLFKKGEVTVTGLELWVDARVRELTEGRQTPATAKPQTITNFAVAMSAGMAASTPARPATAPGGGTPAPGWSLAEGEVGLSGKVASVDAAAGTFVLNADTFVVANDPPMRIQPRPMAIQVGAETAGRALADLKPGDSVRVKAKDTGQGKPMAATEVR